ncbi:Anhydro-N-acetylmuramic acid kinase [Hartmannibacter diazotrophicus]|uniref:Anhydro-N-acetylmuramic acid kinase n=1 Tax=Hartmannibacter diazotrophicus TaxID=1482074 RepID=A0A2C9D854_9HYPH|nr:anhydro-N-acetylmuramic acid kinase [Hartmannibacter diazotrophicus]SON56502.1 Anhydro-N-acetylmuramic acid kinase [Hartmannibacter diazotrophicus]
MNSSHPVPQAGRPVWCLGLMSGTSMDGVDAALILTDGETIADFGPTHFRPYKERERDAMRAALKEARGLDDRSARPPALAEAERIVTDCHIEVVRTLVAKADEAGIAAALVGFHGQTVFHAPDRRLTVQIGDGARLAHETGLPVIFDMRAADVASGGQGAPLVPVYHRALAQRAGLALPVVLANLGGVANITYLGADGTLGAFDTGPANALMDDFISRRLGHAFDEAGQIAAKGRVYEATLARLMDNPYFAAPWPKSLDRDAFDASAVEALSVEDGLATLAAFTARSLAAGIALLPDRPTRIVAVGGGARNPVLLGHIAEACGVDAVAGDTLGFAGDFVEAQAFGFLAARSVRGLPLTFPGTTGVREPMRGGVVAEAA